jgi:hypothetical protein
MAELITRGLDEPLPWLRRIELGLHTLLCAPCQRFAAQAAALDEAAGRLVASPDMPAEGEMPDETRLRLERAIREELAREG